MSSESLTASATSTTTQLQNLKLQPAEERTHSDSFAVHGPKLPFESHTFELHPLQPWDVEIKVSHCGVCYSDIHTVDGDWGDHHFWPVVPGHEIIGVVTQVGAQVQDIQVGMRVGVGPQATSCKKCHCCRDGQETYCTQGFTSTYGSKLSDGYVTRGGFARYHRADAHFVHPIPENLDSAHTAPILCAGITVYTPMKNNHVGPGTKIAVIGIGGLGHMALQFANALGAEVTAISNKDDQEECKKLGAHHYLSSNASDEEFEKHKHRYDLVLNTTNVQLDWHKYLTLITQRGSLVVLGLAPGKMQFENFDLVLRGVKIQGSLVGPPAYVREMLELCSKNNIRAMIETTPYSNVNAACDKVRKNQAKYRVVLEMPTDE